MTDSDEVFKIVSERQTADLYDELAPIYNSLYSRYYFKRNVSRVEEHIRGESILVCGCGTGRLAKRLDDHFETVAPFDFSEGMLEVAKMHAENVMRADVSNLPFKNNTFDGATLLGGIIGYMGDKSEVVSSLNEVYSTLTNDSVVIFDAYSRRTPVTSHMTGSFQDHHISADYRMDDKTDETLEVQFDISVNGVGEITSSTMINCFEKKEIREMVEKSNFDRVELFEQKERSNVDVYKLIKN